MTNAMTPTPVPVADYLSQVSVLRQQEARVLIDIMQAISGEAPIMWGQSIIGFGTQHYAYDSGREGDMPRLAFSPRKAAMTIYFSEGFDRYGAQLAAFGTHKTSVSCLYINKLAAVNVAALTDMLKISYELSAAMPSAAAVPAAALPKLTELRQLVKKTLPHATEVHSYGIIGYKIDTKRARVFVSGWKDHVAVYPVPNDAALKHELAPYIKGKGTLWFPLDQPLPIGLIERTIAALAR